MTLLLLLIIRHNKANTADVANTYAPNFDFKTSLSWELDPLLTTPKLMIDTSAFSTSQGLTNLEASITAVGNNQTNNYYTKTQTDGLLGPKLNSVSPAWTSTATGANLTLTGNLLVQGSNIITRLASKRNIFDSYSKTDGLF